MVGITKLLSSVFAPQFRFSKLKRPKTTHGPFRKRVACRRGKRLDRELAASEFSFKSSKHILPETQAVQEWLTNHNYVIVSSQLRGDKDGLHTFADLIIQSTKTGKYIVVEIKSGCLYRDFGVGSLRFQTQVTSDCLLHQHQLQVLLTRWILNKPDWGVLLLYVTNTEITSYEEAEFGVTLYQEAWTAMVKRARAKMAKRKSKTKD